MESINGRRNRFIEYSLFIACLLSNLSQLPVLVRSGYTQQLAFPGWILVLITVLFSRRLIIKRSMLPQLGLAAALLMWLLLDSLFTQGNLFSSSMIYSYLISFFVFLLGAWTADYIYDDVIDKIIGIFIISMLVVSASIFVQYFGIGYNLATRLYAYSSKNSVSQIIFTAIILLIVRYQPQKAFWKIVKILAIAFEIYVILLLRSRATLVSLILAIFAIAFSRNAKKRIKVAIGLIGIIVIILLLTNSSFNDFIFNNVIFAGRNAANLNELTSGRVNIIESFPDRISGNWLTGIGSTYFECFPLSAILQFGLPGGLLIIIISLQPLLASFNRRNQSQNWNLLFLISLGYSVNGLFEGLTPFGPGVKCYFMWLLYGILLSQMNRTEEGNALN